MEHLLDVFEQHFEGDDLNIAFCEAVGGVIPLREIAIFDYDASAHRLVCRYAPGLPASEIRDLTYDLGHDLCGTAALAGEMVKAFASRRDGRELGSVQRVAIPMLHGKQCVGVLEICRDSADPGFTPEELGKARTAALLYAQRRMLDGMGRALPHKPSFPSDAQRPIGMSSAYERTQRLLLRAAPSNSPILILGESGTGKELCARQIHESSLRSRKPMVVINCPSLSEAHLESELFGHVRGAYTGAIRQRQGKLREADGGTVFLDEVAELNAICQAKILRTLDSGEITPLGSDRIQKVDVRFIAATNRPLDRLAERGVFREDLLYRLRGMQIELPPLRDRRGDLELLAAHFLKEQPPRRGAFPRDFEPAAMALMRAYTWPGNIRELKQAVQSAALLAEGPLVRAQDLPAVIRETLNVRPATPSPLDGPLYEERLSIASALRETAYPITGRWNLAAASRRLGIPRTTLEYRIRSIHGLRER